MCGRYNLITDVQTIIDFFEVEQTLMDVASWKPRYNIAPGQNLPVVLQKAAESDRMLAALRWGLVPPWGDCQQPRISPINARAETVSSKPMFRRAFERRRCLIPATGFYEWAKTPQGKKPFHFSRQDGQLFAFAGIWEQCRSEQNEIVESYAILVTEANKLVRQVHDRMPVILHRQDYARWLDVGNSDLKALNELLKPLPEGEMKMAPANPCVNNARNDSPECALAEGGAPTTSGPCGK